MDIERLNQNVQTRLRSRISPPVNEPYGKIVLGFNVQTNTAQVRDSFGNNTRVNPAVKNQTINNSNKVISDNKIFFL